MQSLNLLKAVLTFKRRSGYSKQQIHDVQQSEFRKLLRYVFDKSPFYHQLYTTHGIKKENLDEVIITDLPFTSKEMLMAHFDEVVTDKRLKFKNIQEWIETHREPHQRFLNEYVIIHTSGTSGALGIFVYDHKAWNTLKASIVTRISKPQIRLFKKINVAFYAAVHGRFAGVTLMSDAPRTLYNLETFSILDPIHKTIERLNAYQPKQLSGYASTIVQLAKLQVEGKLTISPEKIIVSGEPLSEETERDILRVWNAKLFNTYAASESVGIGVRASGTHYMKVFDDLHIVEILDENKQEVKELESGQVVLTNLYNRTFPMIRYQMRDIAIRGMDTDDEQFSSIRKIIGRLNDALPIRLDNHQTDTLHPNVLVEFFLPGLDKVQFISEGPQHVSLKYIATNDMDNAVSEKFKALLEMKGAGNGTSVKSERVFELPNNPKTGKFQLVRINS